MHLVALADLVLLAGDGGERGASLILEETEVVVRVVD
jgi:hypothetical protein